MVTPSLVSSVSLLCPEHCSSWQCEVPPGHQDPPVQSIAGSGPQNPAHSQCHQPVDNRAVTICSNICPTQYIDMSKQCIELYGTTSYCNIAVYFEYWLNSNWITGM